MNPRFIRKPLDHGGERTPYMLAVDAICERYPGLDICDAMRCASLDGLIDDKLLSVLVRGAVGIVSLGLPLPQERRETAKATRQPSKHRSPRDNGFKSESDFTSAALKEARKLPGVFVWRQNSGQRGGVRFGGEKGAPDLMGIVGKRGLFFGVELKQPGETTSLDQDAWHRLAIERGGMIWVATTLDEVVRPLVEALR